MNISMRLDRVDLLAMSFLLVGSTLFAIGLSVDTRALSEFFQVFVDEWTPGFIIDGLLLLVVNRIIRSNERNGVLAQIGSLSNDFALDAVRRARREGWLTDGSLHQRELKKAKLQYADLSGADLRGVDLRFADLRGVSLSHADLRGAVLTGANLSDADLRWANVSDAQMRWAELQGARVDGLIMEQTDLRFASVDEDFAASTGCTQGIVGGHLDKCQVALLRKTFAEVERCGEQAIDLFYDNLFAARPDLRPMFSSSRQRQSRKFLQSLRMIINALGEPERNIEVLEQLGARHKGYGVQASHYEVGGQVLIATLESLFGDRFTREVREAWQAGFGMIAAVMMQAA
ncbi:MAG: pentapeptide repeat-containing protein [Pseudomonadota bacterium]